MRHAALIILLLTVVGCDNASNTPPAGDAGVQQAATTAEASPPTAATVAKNPSATTMPSATTQPAVSRHVAPSAEEVQPLVVGQAAPVQTLHNVKGEPTSMADVYAAGPTVLVFYRGGWCPYCNTQLSELAAIKDKLFEQGFKIVAVSPDRPEKLAESIAKNKLDYTLLSDATADLAIAFGLAFQVDAATVEKYAGYGIDLAKASGHDHHVLPVPAVFLINAQGQIRFAYANPDYKTRLSGDELLAAAKAMQ